VNGGRARRRATYIRDERAGEARKRESISRRQRRPATLTTATAATRGGDVNRWSAAKKEAGGGASTRLQATHEEERKPRRRCSDHSAGRRRRPEVRSTAAGVRRSAGGRRSTQASWRRARERTREEEDKYHNGCDNGSGSIRRPVKPLNPYILVLTRSIHTSGSTTRFAWLSLVTRHWNSQLRWQKNIQIIRIRLIRGNPINLLLIFLFDL
jgi:hypothetical protein